MHIMKVLALAMYVGEYPQFPVYCVFEQLLKLDFVVWSYRLNTFGVSPFLPFPGWRLVVAVVAAFDSFERKNIGGVYS